MSLGREQTDAAHATAEHSPDGQPQTISLAGAGDRCVNCGAPLASDQRYCVNCGERRGKPRFTLAGPAAETAPDTTPTRSAGAPRRPRTSASFNLIAGVATLLIAMGVGVLIGHENSSGNGKSAGTPATQVITVGGGGSGAANTSTAASAGHSGGGSTAKSSSGKSGKAKSAKAPPPKVVVQQAQQAASKVTGGSANVAGATATQGSSCSAGQAGCQNGKLTGNYFGQ
jgi:hypothetical protein